MIVIVLTGSNESKPGWQEAEKEAIHAKQAEKNDLKIIASSLGIKSEKKRNSDDLDSQMAPGC